MTDLLEEIRASWGWTGIDPSEIVGENDFGNLMVKDVQGRYWRICPDDPSCEVVASSRPELDHLSHDQEFSGVLGGAYDVSNITTAPLIEMVRFAGHIAEQIRDMPDGAKIVLNVVD